MWKWVVLLLVVVVVIYLARNRRKGPEVPAGRIEEFDLRLSHEARVAIGTAIAKGRKIQAIKLYRDDTGADLATSRAAIEKWYKGIRG